MANFPQVGVEITIIGINKFKSASKQYFAVIDEMNKKTKEASAEISNASKSIASISSMMSEAAPISAQLANKINRLAYAAADLTDKKRAMAAAMNESADSTDFLSRGILSIMDNIPEFLIGAQLMIGAIKTIGQVIKDTVEDYIEFARTVQRTSNLLGSSIKEAEAWVNILRTMGISQSQAERSIAQFAKRYTDLVLDIASGKEATNDFARAMRRMGIDIRDSQDQLKDLPTLLEEIVIRLGETEAGALRNEFAISAFGRSGRNIADLAQNFEDVQRAVENMGGSLSTLTNKQLVEYYIATGKATIATQNLKNMVSPGFTTVLTVLKTSYAGVTNALVDYTQLLYAVPVIATLVIQKQMSLTEAVQQFGKAIDEINDKLRDTLNIEEATADGKDELTLASAALAEEEDKLQREIAETIEKYNELARTLDDKLIAAYDRYLQRIEDVGIQSQRSVLNEAIRLYQKLSQEVDKAADRREKIERDRNRRIRELQEDWVKAQRRFEEDANDAREKLAIDHSERLRQINQDYYDSVDEAARSNDAVAVLRARRRRVRETRDETIRFGIRGGELEKRLAKTRRRLDEDAKDRIKRERERAADRVKEIEREYDSRRALEEDKLRQLLEVLNAHNLEEFNAIRDAKDKEKAIIDLKLRQRLDDAERNWRRQEDAARNHYIRERNIIREQAGLTNAEFERLILQYGRTAASATGTAIRMIATTAAQGIAQFGGQLVDVGGSYGTYPGISRAQGGVDVVNSPTHFIAGDAGPEMHAWMPLRGNMNVNHSFGNLPVNVNGQGAGNMNRSQMEALVWDCLDYIGDRMNVGRH